MRRMDKPKMGISFLLGCLLCFTLSAGRPAQAGFLEEVRLTASDSGGVYRYEWDQYGGFYTSVLQGETAGFVYISIDDTLDYRMMKDGEAYTCAREDILVEDGSYTLYLFAKGEETKDSYCAFGFQIVAGDFAMEDGGAYAPADASFYSGIGVTEAKMGFFFDREKELMCYGAGGRVCLETNLPNGAVSSAPVCLRAADGVTQTVRRNGEYIECPADGVFRESGFYQCVQMLYPDAAGGAGEDNTIFMTEFSFWIVDGKETRVNVVGAPEGFFLEHVYFQGAEQEIPQNGHYFLQEEGKYLLEFASEEDDSLTYMLELTKDTTAPFLDFSQEIEGGKAAAPLLISSNDPSCSYEVARNGVKYDYVQGEPLKTAGYYEVVITDGYGNSRKYAFLLEAAYEFFSPGMILLLSSLAAVLLAVLYRSGRDLTVL